jgi:hypothetical protein
LNKCSIHNNPTIAISQENNTNNTNGAIIYAQKYNMSEKPKDLSDYGEEIEKELENLIHEGVELNENLYKGHLTVISFMAEYTIKPLQLEYENNIKSIDVIIDILKFAIPINFTLIITSYSVAVLHRASGWLLGIFLGLIVLLLIFISKRHDLTKKYIFIYKKAHDLLYDAFRDGGIVGLDKAIEFISIKSSVAMG